MGSCKEIVTILSKSEDISFFKKVRLQWHFLLCKNCRTYKKHLQIISKCMKKLFENRMTVTQEEIKKIEEQNYIKNDENNTRL